MNKKISEIWKFLTEDIWRITENEVTRTKYSIYNIIKTIYLCIDRFIEDRIMNKAAALTYSTLLATVPILAILFAIARGFGFSNIMESQLHQGLGGNTETTRTLMQFVDSYLSETRGGVFIGVGLVLLLGTVLNLINNIEITFNRIWNIKKMRSWHRMITDYFSMLLITPILLVLSGGITIFMSTMLEQMTNYELLTPVFKILIGIIPFAFTRLMFTALYAFMPNTTVKFKYSFLSGILAGTAYQALLYLYITSQLFFSKFNVIFGTFAALPLFLLFMHISWTI